MLLNPVFNNSHYWQWINMFLLCGGTMAKLYYSGYDIDKQDLKDTCRKSLEIAAWVFDSMQLPIGGQELVKRIETEQKKAYELAILATEHQGSCLSLWNATRANLHRHNADALIARLKHEYGDKL